jgi:hypothetical protein
MIRSAAILPLVLAAGALAPCIPAQQAATPVSEAVSAESVSALPDAPSAAQQSQAQPGQPAQAAQSEEGQQTRRILGIIPNFRSVSVDQKLPPLSSNEKFKLMFEDSFDYSDFIYVGILAGISQAEGSYPEFHTGAPAYARYYWHSFVDTADGNLMTEFLMPVATHEDPRYYTLGRGGLFKRTGYAVTRLLVTRTDNGGMAPNFSEIVGNGAASGISNLYYPSPERTWTKTGQRWVTQVGLDGFSNLIKEFWPDVNSRLFHNKY